MTHKLDNLFAPRSIAVIGATDKANSVGRKVFKNLLQGNFVGKIYAVNPKHKEVQSQPCFSSVKKIDQSVDLVVITTPAKTVPAILRECGEKYVYAAIVISAGFSETGQLGKELEQTIVETARRYHIRLMGPNCLGLMRPSIKINATFDNNVALPGDLAFVSQSGALSASILDWAVKKHIGFSAIVSLGNGADVDFGDVLDYLTSDPETKSILLYIEGIHNTQRFMSALRAAARVKPVIAIKAGRHPQGSRAALSHTGALIGDDDVFDSALRRAGALRVFTIEELFLATKVLSSNYRVKGNRLMIISNGGGAGVMAADRAAELSITLPTLNETTLSALNHVLPAQWSHQNPVDIIGDATPQRYHAALDICAKDDEIDGILTLLVPVAMSRPLKVARQVVQDAKQYNKPILACWMGERQVKSSWKLFETHNMLYFDTPEKAVVAFSYLADYQRNQQLLLQPIEPFSLHPKPDIAKARLIVESALAEHRTVLTTIESKAILTAFLIPVTQAINTCSSDEAINIAKSFGFPVVMKINSHDISHKQDIGGVFLNINSVESVCNTFAELIANAKKYQPDAKILGVTVEPMCKNLSDRELMIGVMHDKVFGPVISFGAGGTLVEIMKDRALALPPLNPLIARQLIDQTRIVKLLGEFRHMPAVNLEKIVNILLRVSEMVCELPYIQEMDINPLIINEKEAMAVDARIVIAEQPKSASRYSHLAIHP